MASRNRADHSRGHGDVFHRALRRSGRRCVAARKTTFSRTSSARRCWCPSSKAFASAFISAVRSSVFASGSTRNWGTGALVGASAPMARVRRLIERVADADAPVLIRGETGTGKELVARALHEMSRRRDQPFVAVNCSALPGTLIESMIFGHERGAFTGADRRVRGQLELAGQGTILLDEIRRCRRSSRQSSCVCLEDRKFRPLASETEMPLRARVLAATHINLEERIVDGRFREDLYYRLNVLSIRLAVAGRAARGHRRATCCVHRRHATEALCSTRKPSGGLRSARGPETFGSSGTPSNVCLYWLTPTPSTCRS